MICYLFYVDLFNCINRETTKYLIRNPDDVTLFFMPLYHAATLNGLFECFMRGLCFVLMNKFTFEGMLQCIQEFKVRNRFDQSAKFKIDIIKNIFKIRLVSFSWYQRLQSNF